MTYEAALEAIAANKTRAPYLSSWRHLKTGHEYIVRMHVILEASLTPAVVYNRRFSAPDETWCRPADEFFDGRFELISKNPT